MVIRHFFQIVVQYWDTSTNHFDEYRTGPMFNLHEYPTPTDAIKAAYQWGMVNVILGAHPFNDSNFVITGRTITRMEWNTGRNPDRINNQAAPGKRTDADLPHPCTEDW